MTWDSFNDYGLGFRDAFETLNNQLFEHYVRREYPATLQSFRAINGSGGDGGIEAYAKLSNGEILAVQSKWFPTSLGDSEIGQIRKSITTANTIRPQIKKYFICVPHDVNSKKIGRGNKLTKNDEEAKVTALVDEMATAYPDLDLIWWFDNELLGQLQQSDNEGVHKYWFEKELFSKSFIKEQFELEKKNYWLKERYVPKLHANGIIDKEYNKLLFGENIRTKLADDLQQTVNKLVHCNRLIDQYLSTNEYSDPIKTGLGNIKSNLSLFIDELFRLKESAECYDENYRSPSIPEYDIWPTTVLIEKTRATNRQKQIRPALIICLRDIHGYKLPEYLQTLNYSFNQSIRVIYGSAGSGKTHGLADCVEKHLAKSQPAVIIQAKGTPCRNWTEILCDSLEITGWNKDEILNAFEAMAIGQDHNNLRSATAACSTFQNTAKVLICVDGLEEEIEDAEEWYSRISETEILTKNHPRVKFIFSARDYFKHNCIDDTIVHSYKEVHLPPDGDVSVSQVATEYFKEYDIIIEDYSFVRQLDNLLALRLFCDLYRGKRIATGEEVATATGELLQMKIEKINNEYIKSLSQAKSTTQQPVFDALLVIAEHYYHATETEHSELSKQIQDKVGTSFSPSEIDILLDFLVQHGILIRVSRKEGSGVLAKTIHNYRITYQSIIEHILSEKIFQDIHHNKIDAIPETLHYEIARPFNPHTELEYHNSPPNLQIIQTIVNRLFIEDGKLIGENGFLTHGFDAQSINAMKLTAIAEAPFEVAIKYKKLVDDWFFRGPITQYSVLANIILPSARREESAFGAEYLHDILIDQPTAFERDKLWSGLDAWEQTEETKHDSNVVNELLDEYGTGVFVLSGFEKYNETPLIYAWALSNIDQTLRNGLRIALTGWALEQPGEFLKLLDKIFCCNDPQIQEDLASIALGISGLLKDKNAIILLARWALENIFNKTDEFRNVVIRQGFRAIVERAAMMGGITPGEAIPSRPFPMTNPPLIDFNSPLTTGHDGEAYPIVHDLAWYVIQRAYDNFLEYPMEMGGKMVDKDKPEAKALLDLYRSEYSNPGIFATGWAMSAAIGYIRNKLGLTRTEGNGWTDESHGGKSKIYTYEEKYTWLAVHYLQGYLSDYIPYTEDDRGAIWIEDYSQLNDIPNPGEDVALKANLLQSVKTDNAWVIKEDIAPTISIEGDIAKNIKDWTDTEPKLDIAKWIEYSSTDFEIDGTSNECIALANTTSLYDASQYGYSQVEVTACLATPEAFKQLKEKISKDPDSLHFIEHLDRMEGSPDTATYSNPSDIVWMDWIGEVNNDEDLYIDGKDYKMKYTLTRITQGTVKGEKFYQIPSKFVRNLMEIRSFKEPLFQTENEETVGFTHQVSEGSYRDSQKMVLVNSNIFFDSVEKAGLTTFWWVEVFKKKNPLFAPGERYPHTQKTYKYLVWKEGDKFQQVNFWNEYFSNRRDNQEDDDQDDLDIPEEYDNA